MKKQKLIIFVFSFSLVLFTQSAAAFGGESFTKTATKSRSFASFSALSHIDIANNACKFVILGFSQRSSAGADSLLIAGLIPCFYVNLKKKILGKNNFSSKEYLLHIYPSHNFW